QIVVFLEAYSRGEIGICVPFGKFKADSSAGTASDEDGKMSFFHQNSENFRAVCLRLNPKSMVGIFVAKVLVSLKGIKFCVKGYSIFYKKESVKKWNVKKPMSFTIPYDLLDH
ncbi:hypothetical protein LINPERPRIM_LOCUS39612, partial [Linum perenne]